MSEPRDDRWCERPSGWTDDGGGIVAESLALLLSDVDPAGMPTWAPPAPW